VFILAVDRFWESVTLRRTADTGSIADRLFLATAHLTSNDAKWWEEVIDSVFLGKQSLRYGI
jgi:hypothetical protein